MCEEPAGIFEPPSKGCPLPSTAFANPPSELFTTTPLYFGSAAGYCSLFPRTCLLATRENFAESAGNCSS